VRRLYARGTDAVVADEPDASVRFFLPDHVGSIRDFISSNEGVWLIRINLQHSIERIDHG
jgi:hypothetical protein